MARSRVASPVGDELVEVIGWYRERLAEPAAAPPAVTLGPTWRIADGRWVLPELTLGWEVLGWCGIWLQHARGRPWRFTPEQARFVLWWYAVDDRGWFCSRDGVFQRLKGHGKDPLGACLCATEMIGPCRFAEWAPDGTPLATDCPEAWVQTAAVSLEQTKNTMRLFPGLFTEEAKRRFRIQVGKEVVHALGDTRMIQAVTSSPATLEGARSTFVLMNETHLWTGSNEGHDMADVIERNTTKSPDGAARTLRITNAPEPGEDSVAERDRDAWQAVEAGKATAIGLLYDSLEAPPDAPLTPEAAPDVIRAIRGDSTWLSVDRVVDSILDVRNPPSRSRRFWYNQIVATEDAWVAPYEWDARADPTVVVADGAEITLGFDGSKSDDDSALIGCLVEADHLFEVEVWSPDPATGEVDRAAIDRAVRATFERYDVVGFYSDLHPFESYVDAWAEELGAGLVVKATVRQPVAWDMRARGAQFTAACERLHDAILEDALTHCGSSRFRQHVHNARRAPNKWGISVRKEHRESARKIDSVPAAVLARLARQDYLALPPARRRRRRTGKASFL